MIGCISALPPNPNNNHHSISAGSSAHSQLYFLHSWQHAPSPIETPHNNKMPAEIEINVTGGNPVIFGVFLSLVAAKFVDLVPRCTVNLHLVVSLGIRVADPAAPNVVNQLSGLLQPVRDVCQ